jgi:glutaredoxin-dependent peroxiredoxin
MKIQIGQKAPLFTLVSDDRQKVSLADYKGKNVLLLFFPFAFSGTCTKELCATRDDIATYNALNIQVLGISIDSFFTLAKYKEDQKLNFPLLSDFNKEVSPMYDSLCDDIIGMKGVSKRSAIVIDKEGIIRHIEVLANASEMPNFVEIKKAISDLN